MRIRPVFDVFSDTDDNITNVDPSDVDANAAPAPKDDRIENSNARLSSNMDNPMGTKMPVRAIAVALSNGPDRLR